VRSELVQRLLVGVVVAPLALAAVWIGGRPFTLVVALVSGLGLWEFYGLLRRHGRRPLNLAGFLASAVLLIGVDRVEEVTWVGGAVTLLLLVGGVEVLARPQAPGHLEDLGLSILGVLTVTWMASYAIRLRATPDTGAAWVLLALLPTWAFDTAAYFSGRVVGRHPFMAHVSPKKTWEGVIGGLLGAGVAATITGVVSGVLSVPSGLVLGVLVGMATQMGDVLESLYKRQVGVKDSGHRLPGHGGVLDRVDGLLFSLMTTYYYGIIIIGLSPAS